MHAVGAADGAVHGRAPADPAAAGVRGGRAAAPLVARPAIRRRAHRFVSVLLLLAAALARPLGRYGVVVDWHEVWTRRTGRTTWAARARGRLGAAAVREGPPACVLLLAAARARLRSEGLRGEVTVLEGEYEGERAARAGARRRHGGVRRAPHTREAGAGAWSRRWRSCRSRAQPRCDSTATAPTAPRCSGESRPRPQRPVHVHGFVDPRNVERRAAPARGMVLPSRREGYGLVVVEASANGMPSVLAPGPTTPRRSSSTRAPTASWPDSPPSRATWPRVQSSACEPRRLAAARAPPPTGSRPTGSRLSLDGSLERVANVYSGERNGLWPRG